MNINLNDMPADSRDLVLQLDRRNRRLVRSLCFIVGLWLFSCLGLFVFISPNSTYAEEATKGNVATDQILRVRGIVVVDERGIERVWIGAPGIDPMILGKRISRGNDRFVGILMFDSQGTERSGYGTDDTGSVYLTLDEIGRQAATFSAKPLGGVSLTLNSRGDGGQKSLTMGTSPKGSYLKLTDQGKVVFQEPADTPKEPK